jgi:hypothetical protein
MAGVAFCRHSPLVGIGMTGDAIPGVAKIGASLVAGGAIIGQLRMIPQEGKTRLFFMVEIGGVERADIHVCALVLLVTDLAIAADLTMDALLGGDPVGDRPMTGEAARGIDRLSIGVAFPAVRGVLERRVGSGQWTGSRLLSLGCLPKEGDNDRQERNTEAQGQTGRLESFVHLKGPSSD